MKLHSNLLTGTQIHTALRDSQTAGLVASTVYFHIFAEKNSRSRDHAFEIQLGCWEKIKGDNRGWKNSGGSGASDVYAATYAEWGHFITALYEVDSEMVFGQYKGVEDFNDQTAYMFAPVPQPDPYPYLLDNARQPRRFAEPSPYVKLAFAPRLASQLLDA